MIQDMRNEFLLFILNQCCAMFDTWLLLLLLFDIKYQARHWLVIGVIRYVLWIYVIMITSRANHRPTCIYL